jgi:hypothetical protein
MKQHSFVTCYPHPIKANSSCFVLKLAKDPSQFVSSFFVPSTVSSFLSFHSEEDDKKSFESTEAASEFERKTYYRCVIFDFLKGKNPTEPSSAIMKALGLFLSLHCAPSFESYRLL